MTGILVSVQCDRLHLLAGRDIRQCLLLGASSQGRVTGWAASSVYEELAWNDSQLKSTLTMSCTRKVPTVHI